MNIDACYCALFLQKLQLAGGGLVRQGDACSRS